MKIIQPLRQKLALPAKLKGGRIEKLVNYWKNVAMDYEEATKDLFRGCRQKPIKASVIGGSLLTFWYLYETKPDEHSFRDAYIRMHHDLTLLPDSNRNKASQSHRDRVTRCENAKTLRFTSLAIATLVWEDRFDAQVGLFSAQCDYVRPTYIDILQNRVIDIGFNGKWLSLEKAMKDFDIDPDEWDEQGKPRNPEGQLKQMW